MPATRAIPTWTKATAGFLGPVLVFATWGAYVWHVMAQADAAQRADPHPAPDAAGLTAGLFYLLPTLCLAFTLLVAGALLCISQPIRPFGLGIVGGVTIPAFALVLAWLILEITPLHAAATK